MHYLFLIAFLFKCGWEFFPRVIFVCLQSISSQSGHLSIGLFTVFCLISEALCKMGTVRMAGAKKSLCLHKAHFPWMIPFYDWCCQKEFSSFNIETEAMDSNDWLCCHCLHLWAVFRFDRLFQENNLYPLQNKSISKKRGMCTPAVIKNHVLRNI